MLNKILSLLLISACFSSAALAIEYKCTPISEDNLGLGVLILDVQQEVIELTDGSEQNCKFLRSSFLPVNGLYRYFSGKSCALYAIDLLPGLSIGKSKLKSTKKLGGYMKVHSKTLGTEYQCEIYARRASGDDHMPSEGASSPTRNDL